MSLASWAVRPTELYAAGGRVSAGAQDATSAASALVRSLEQAGAAVHHPRLVAALERYRETVTGPAQQLPVVVADMGSRLQASAVTASEADAEAVRDLRRGSTLTERATGSLLRDLAGAG